MDMHGVRSSLPCTKCLSTESSTGAEKGTLKEAEIDFVSLRKKLRPMSSGFDHGSLANVHTVELKSQESSQAYLRLLKLRGAKTCTICAGKGRYLEKTRSPPPTIALDGGGRQCVTATALLGDCLEVIRKTTIRAPATQVITSGFSRPINLPICPPAGLLRRSGHRRMKRGMTPALLHEATSSDVHIDDVVGLLQWEKDEEVTDPEIICHVKIYIRNRMGVVADQEHYPNVRVKSANAIKRFRNLERKLWTGFLHLPTARLPNPRKKCRMKKLLIRVQGEGSWFYGNRGFHETNSIYFDMGPDKCWQRWFCTDDITGTSHKICKDSSTGNRGGVGLSIALSQHFRADSESPRAAPVVPVSPIPIKSRHFVKTRRRKAFVWASFLDDP